MKINKIEVQKRNKKRSSIYIDGEFKFGLDNEIILKYDIKEGDELNEEQVKNLLLAEEKQKIKQRAYRLLRFRNRSIAEMKGRLEKLGYEPEIVEEVVQELIEEGTLNDHKFARGLINDYTNLKPKGNIFIMNELRKKKVDDRYIQELLRERNEKELIKSIIEKKFSDFNKKDPKKKARIIRYLLYRGFTLQAIYEVLGEDYE
uniref:Regulatory protein RecX n=1 Tax=candidate division WOR-3 bacterium TaxID=2052148 RepID=A0A7V0Z7E2_UNCW3